MKRMRWGRGKKIVLNILRLERTVGMTTTRGQKIHIPFFLRREETFHPLATALTNLDKNSLAIVMDDSSSTPIGNVIPLLLRRWPYSPLPDDEDAATAAPLLASPPGSPPSCRCNVGIRGRCGAAAAAGGSPFPAPRPPPPAVVVAASSIASTIIISADVSLPPKCRRRRRSRSSSSGCAADPVAASSIGQGRPRCATVGGLGRLW